MRVSQSRLGAAYNQLDMKEQARGKACTKLELPDRVKMVSPWSRIEECNDNPRGF